MPDQGMSTHLFSILFGKFEEFVTLSKIENSWLGLNRLPIIPSWRQWGWMVLDEPDTHHLSVFSGV